ncbi:MAG: hypothetical protein ACLPGW_01425 [Roseiarcus sp.]
MFNGVQYILASDAALHHHNFHIRLLSILVAPYVPGMSWYVVIKTIKGRRYRYRQRTWRENGRVRCKSEYIGPVDATFFRGGGKGSMPSGKTAQDVLNYETRDLGNSLEIVDGVELSAVPSERLQRVTKSKKAASEYGEVSRVPVAEHRVIARDRFGGFLIELLPRERASGVTEFLRDLVRKKKRDDDRGETEAQVRERIAIEDAERSRNDRVNDLLTADTISLDAVDEIADMQADAQNEGEPEGSPDGSTE